MTEFTTREMKHKIWCDEMHQHRPPRCCAPDCWCQRTFDEQFKILLELKEGWDTYSGKPISKKSLDAAREFLLKHVNIIPCSSGGVQIEWHCHGIDLELMFDADGKLKDGSLEVEGLGLYFDPKHGGGYDPEVKAVGYPWDQGV